LRGSASPSYPETLISRLAKVISEPKHLQRRATDGVKMGERLPESLPKGVDLSQPRRKVFVKEIVLENFMSYEYAKIPLKVGLNVVCGPNGAGKSSILLALSVALGQAYTERSKRLSDLIRRGKENARVTLLFDNSPGKDGRRPIPSSDSDLFRLSRYLRKNGEYWFEADYRGISKGELSRLLDSFGINPDNMLIIMHQNMVEEFSVVSPQQKLLMVEEAVGFQPYRQRIMEAQQRLMGLLSEETSIASLLGSAEQTLAYWKEQYDRYLRKKELLQKKSQLERELAWAQVVKLEKSLEAVMEEEERKRRRLIRIRENAEKTKKEGKELQHDIGKLRFERNQSLFTLIGCEKEKAGNEIYTKLSGEFSERMESLQAMLDRLENSSGRSEGDGYRAVREKMEEIQSWLEEIQSHSRASMVKMKELNSKISLLQKSLSSLEQELDSLQEMYVEKRVREALLNYQGEELEDQLRQLGREEDRLKEELETLASQAREIGPRVETHRLPQEISDEIKTLTAHLVSLADVNPETEKIYRKYQRVYEELKQKSEVLAENRAKMLEEVDVRKKAWRKVLENFLAELNQTYRQFLSTIGALGNVKLVNAEDVETAGLELYVGFHGTAPTPLDAYTQSGGERTTAIMAFLLALQRYVKSPIRAVDEFDIHMDPRNRETVSKLIAQTVGEQEQAQYIIITPWHLPIFDQEAHLIIVQNVAGRSEVKTVNSSEAGSKVQG